MKKPTKCLSRAVAFGLLAALGMTQQAAAKDLRLAGQGRVAAVSDSEREEAPANATFSGEGIGAFLAGRQAKKDGNTGVAANYYRRVLAQDPQNEWLARRLFILNIGNGRIDEAIPAAGRILENNKSAPVANLVRAVDLMVEKRYGKAEGHVADALKSGALRLIGPSVRAWAAFGSGDLKRASARLKSSKEKASQKVFRLHHLGLLLGAGGDYAGALAAYDDMPDGARLSLRTRLIYASLLEKRDGPDAAMAYLKGLTARYGENPVLQTYLTGRLPISAAFPVKTAQDGLAEALYGTALALSQDSINEVSRIYLRLALYVRPGLDVAQLLLGDMLDDQGNWEEAIAAFRTIDPESPYSWQARIRVAWALDSLKRTDEAATLLRQMSDERPETLTTLATLADVYRGHRRFAEAADVYGEAIRRLKEPEPRHWSIFYAHGIALERTKRWDAAEASLLKALELSPNQPLVMNYLGYSWADQGVKLDRAVEMIERAVERRPTDGYIIDSLGWAHFRAGDFKLAEKHLERATELRPGDPTINDHLGDVYWHTGRRRESCFQWRHALSLDPDEEQIPLIKQKLSEGLGGQDAGFRGCHF